MIRRRSLILLMGATLLVAVGVRPAAARDLAEIVPADAVVFAEAIDLAGLRQDVLGSAFWRHLRDTAAFARREASEKGQARRARFDDLLVALDMNAGEAMAAYFGGRAALVVLAGEGEHGVVITEVAEDAAQRLAEAVGAAPISPYRGARLWEVADERKVDRMAWTDGLLLVGKAASPALDRVLDTLAGAGPALASEAAFAEAVGELPAGWRVRAWTTDAKPYGLPGAAALYKAPGGTLRLLWQSDRGDAPAPPAVNLLTPAWLPPEALAAAAVAVDGQALWQQFLARAGATEGGEVRIRKVERLLQAFFPGYRVADVAAAFGPEAAVALTPGVGDGRPALVAVVALREGGRPVAEAFRSGLVAKAMLLGALTAEKEGGPVIDVAQETVAGCPVTTIRGSLEKLPGPLAVWAAESGITMGVTDGALVVGTSPESVRAAVAAAVEGTGGLAAALASESVVVPNLPAAGWGVLEPARGADAILALAGRFIEHGPLEASDKLLDLSEVLRLVERITWRRTDGPVYMRGEAEIVPAK